MPGVFKARPDRPPRLWYPDLAQQPSRDDLVLVLAGSVKDADYSWLDLQPYDYVLMMKELPQGTANNLLRNSGQDVASYAQFILEHYDHLPERMVFTHGHRLSWHTYVRGLHLLLPVALAPTGSACRSLRLAVNLTPVPICCCCAELG